MNQSWCKNLVIADVISENIEIRNAEAITMVTRKIQEYEYKTLIKPNKKLGGILQG